MCLCVYTPMRAHAVHYMYMYIVKRLGNIPEIIINNIINYKDFSEFTRSFSTRDANIQVNYHTKGIF